MRALCLLILCLMLPIIGSVSAFANRYSVQNLGAADGALSRPFGINSGGQICALNRTGGQYRAFLYDNGTWTNLGTLGGAYSRAEDIGDAGHVAGTSTNAGGQRRGFLWTPGGTNGVAGNPQMREIGTFGGASSEGAAVNGLGQVAGSANNSSEKDQAFLFDNGLLIPVGGVLQTNLGLPWSYGYGINEAGDVVGEAYDDNFTTRIAFLYRGGEVTNIGHLGSGKATAFDVNTNRQVTGYSSSNGVHDRAFRWGNGSMQNLGTLGGAVSYGFAINNHGHVVGASDIDGTFTNGRAFVAFDNTMLNLNEWLDETGTNWLLLEARDINDAGQIVGLGRFNSGLRMFLLNPRPVMTGIRRDGASVVVQFIAINNALYVVDTGADLMADTWVPGSNAVTGSGGVIAVTNPSAGIVEFQRVRLVTP